MKAKTARSKATKVTAATPLKEATEQKGDLIIHDLWQNGTDSVYYTFVLNTDVKSHSAKTPEKCLQEAERANNKIYLDTCLQQRRRFSPFVASFGGLMGVEATTTPRRIASRFATKLRQTYSRTCGYIKCRVYINLVRAMQRCIWGSRVPYHKISVQSPQWEDSNGINLFR